MLQALLVILVCGVTGLILITRNIQIRPVREFLRRSGVKHPHSRIAFVELSRSGPAPLDVTSLIGKSLELADNLSPSLNMASLRPSLEVHCVAANSWRWRLSEGTWNCITVRPSPRPVVEIKSGVNWRELVFMCVLGLAGSWYGLVVFLIALALIQFDFDCTSQLLAHQLKSQAL